MRGRLVAIEGADGTGKTTLARRLADRLGATCQTTPTSRLREHRDAVDAALANEPLAARLFYVASVLSASATIDGLLAEGRDVIVDRYWLSTLASAAVEGIPLDLPEVERRLVPASVTLYLCADLEVRRARLSARGMSDNDRRSLSPATSCALDRCFRALADHPAAGRFLALDTTALDPCATEAAALDLLDSASRRLGQLLLFPACAEAA